MKWREPGRASAAPEQERFMETGMDTLGKPRLGVIGLGIMGTAMTQRLLEQGWSVTVWNLEP